MGGHNNRTLSWQYHLLSSGEDSILSDRCVKGSAVAIGEKLSPLKSSWVVDLGDLEFSYSVTRKVAFPWRQVSTIALASSHKCTTTKARLSYTRIDLPVTRLLLFFSDYSPNWFVCLG